MSIITQCPQCGKKLRAPPELLGTEARCPKCKTGFTIAGTTESAVATAQEPNQDALPSEREPAGSDGGSSSSAPSGDTAISKASGGGGSNGSGSEAEAKTGASEPVATAKKSDLKAELRRAAAARSRPPLPPMDRPEWFVQTAEGTEYGPVTRKELDNWLAEDRLDAECQVLKEGWQQWKWVEEIYPQLAPDAAALRPGNNASTVAMETVGRAAALDAGGAAVSQHVAQAISGTRPWVLLFAVLAFIASGLSAIGLIPAILVVLQKPVEGIVLLLFAGSYTAIFGYLGVLLAKYSSACVALFRTGSAGDLEAALDAQQRFWKFGGILSLVALGILALATVLFSLVLQNPLAKGFWG